MFFLKNSWVHYFHDFRRRPAGRALIVTRVPQRELLELVAVRHHLRDVSRRVRVAQRLRVRARDGGFVFSVVFATFFRIRLLAVPGVVRLLHPDVRHVPQRRLRVSPRLVVGVGERGDRGADTARADHQRRRPRVERGEVPRQPGGGPSPFQSRARAKRFPSLLFRAFLFFFGFFAGNARTRRPVRHALASFFRFLEKRDERRDTAGVAERARAFPSDSRVTRERRVGARRVVVHPSAALSAAASVGERPPCRLAEPAGELLALQVQRRIRDRFFFVVSRRLSPRSPPKRARRLRRGESGVLGERAPQREIARAHAPRSTALNSAVAAAFRNGSSSSSVTDKRCATSSFSLVTFLFINRTSRATRGVRKLRNSQSPASSLREHKARHSAAARRLSARRSWIERDRSSASADRCAGKGSAPLVTKKERSSSSSSSSPSSFNSFSFNSDSAPQTASRRCSSAFVRVASTDAIADPAASTTAASASTSASPNRGAERHERSRVARRVGGGDGFVTLVERQRVGERDPRARAGCGDRRDGPLSGARVAREPEQDRERVRDAPAGCAGA